MLILPCVALSWVAVVGGQAAGVSSTPPPSLDSSTLSNAPTLTNGRRQAANTANTCAVVGTTHLSCVAASCYLTTDATLSAAFFGCCRYFDDLCYLATTGCEAWATASTRTSRNNRLLRCSGSSSECVTYTWQDGGARGFGCDVNPGVVTVPGTVNVPTRSPTWTMSEGIPASTTYRTSRPDYTFPGPSGDGVAGYETGLTWQAKIGVGVGAAVLASGAVAGYLFHRSRRRGRPYVVGSPSKPRSPPPDTQEVQTGPGRGAFATAAGGGEKEATAGLRETVVPVGCSVEGPRERPRPAVRPAAPQQLPISAGG